ncbi:hypothetical protein CDG81_04715 [Actinopolyspora erythraea]|uniref:Colicin D immunity protein domain-containing protein n=1 Tax=Actinopolyspora erythraea TaxID=414996 RepID=A0A099D1M4_9ACTN|nr:hypothetical protein [Actinopolyspora erythraea]ASU80832.1 hypothetical protein CDG81_04715 [Actinopolyspora erythraea]KGI79939.1 hypothetical protein IL38_19680 [Actinopolyspora erythraea]
MPSPESAARRLREHAVLWSAREVRAEEVVRVACDALVVGLDSPALRILAACTRAEADDEVRELLTEVLGELGLVFYPLDGEAAWEPAVRLLARRFLAGETSPRDFTRRLHRNYGHEVDAALPFVELDELYDTLDYTECTVAELDDEVIAEARRIAAHPNEPSGPTSTSG